MKSTRCVCGRNIDDAGLLLCESCYAKEKAAREIPELVTCSGCGVRLEPSMPGSEAWGQFEDALEVQFHGGYSMYIDPIPPGEVVPTAVLCKDCADALVNSAPWADKLLSGLR